jgi:hypothetical protein
MKGRPFSSFTTCALDMSRFMAMLAVGAPRRRVAGFGGQAVVTGLKGLLSSMFALLASLVYKKLDRSRGVVCLMKLFKFCLEILLILEICQI